MYTIFRLIIASFNLLFIIYFAIENNRLKRAGRISAMHFTNLLRLQNICMTRFIKQLRFGFKVNTIECDDTMETLKSLEEAAKKIQKEQKALNNTVRVTSQVNDFINELCDTTQETIKTAEEMCIIYAKNEINNGPKLEPVNIKDFTVYESTKILTKPDGTNVVVDPILSEDGIYFPMVDCNSGELYWAKFDKMKYIPSCKS